MFTGIITDVGEVISVHPRGEGLHRLKIDDRLAAEFLLEQRDHVRQFLGAVVTDVVHAPRRCAACGITCCGSRLRRRRTIDQTDDRLDQNTRRPPARGPAGPGDDAQGINSRRDVEGQHQVDRQPP